MDNIMKNVQGNYIKYFEQKLKFVIGLVLQKCSSNQEDQKRLFKLFKSWEVLGLFNHRILEDIAAQHNLRTLVSSVRRWPCGDGQLGGHIARLEFQIRDYSTWPFKASLGPRILAQRSAYTMSLTPSFSLFCRLQEAQLSPEEQKKIH